MLNDLLFYAVMIKTKKKDLVFFGLKSEFDDKKKHFITQFLKKNQWIKRFQNVKMSPDLVMNL